MLLYVTKLCVLHSKQAWICRVRQKVARRDDELGSKYHTTLYVQHCLSGPTFQCTSRKGILCAVHATGAVPPSLSCSTYQHPGLLQSKLRQQLFQHEAAEQH